MARRLTRAMSHVGDLSDDSLVAVPVHASVSEALATIEARAVRRLLVTADDDRVYGILSLDDLLDALAHEMSELAHALRVRIGRQARARSAFPLGKLGALRMPSSVLA